MPLRHACRGEALGTSALPVLVFDTDHWAIEDFRIVLGPADLSSAGASSIGPAFEAELHRIRGGPGGLAEVELTVETVGPAAVAAVQRALEDSQPFTAVFVDAGAPPAYWGLDVAEAVRALDPEVQIVLTAAQCDFDPRDLSARIPPADRLSVQFKPIHPCEIQHLVLAAAARRDDDRARALVRRKPRDEPGSAFTDWAIGLIVIGRDGRVETCTAAIADLFPEASGKIAPGRALPKVLKRLLTSEALRSVELGPLGAVRTREVKLADERRSLAVPVRARGGANAILFVEVPEPITAEDPRRGLGRRPEDRVDN